jgi:hypothetical protein
MKGLNTPFKNAIFFELVILFVVAGHLLLEQYEAQVSAALRPAFSVGAVYNSSEVTAAACEVCSAWIAASAHGTGWTDLRRVHHLLSTALESRLPSAASSGDRVSSQSRTNVEKKGLEHVRERRHRSLKKTLYLGHIQRLLTLED